MSEITFEVETTLKVVGLCFTILTLILGYKNYKKVRDLPLLRRELAVFRGLADRVPLPPIAPPPPPAYAPAVV